MTESGAYFEKQRDLLIQEIGISIDSVVHNLDVLNRSLNGSISVGKEFDNVARLWSHFYLGLNQLKDKSTETKGEYELGSEGDAADLNDAQKEQEEHASNSNVDANAERDIDSREQQENGNENI